MGDVIFNAFGPEKWAIGSNPSNDSCWVQQLFSRVSPGMGRYYNGH